MSDGLRTAEELQRDVARPEGLVERLMAGVCDHIRKHRLEPGAVLPSEADFAAQLGVSRAVAREGFRGLSALRVIDVGNGRRARVAYTDDTVLSLMLDHAINTRQIAIQQILDVRRTIELRTATLAALRRSEEAATEIEAAAEHMRLSLDHSEQVMEHDIDFHQAIARASQNPLFNLIVSSFATMTRTTWPIGWAVRVDRESRAENIDCHLAIADAIRRRDVRGAEKAMAYHFDSAVKVLIDAGVV